MPEDEKGKTASDVACILMGGHICPRCENGYVGYISPDQEARFRDDSDRASWISNTIVEGLCVDCILAEMEEITNVSRSMDMAQWRKNLRYSSPHPNTAKRLRRLAECLVTPNANILEQICRGAFGGISVLHDFVFPLLLSIRLMGKGPTVTCTNCGGKYALHKVFLDSVNHPVPAYMRERGICMECAVAILKRAATVADLLTGRKELIRVHRLADSD